MTDWLSRYDDEVAVPPAEREQAEREENTLPVVEKSSNERLEKAQELHENNVALSSAQRWSDRPDWAEDERSRKINPMHYGDFIAKCHSVGCYIVPNDFTHLGRIGLNGVSRGIFRTVTTLQYPYSYEYSVMRFNRYRVPTNEKFRGWRTAILHLIAADVMTKDQAERAFGKPQGTAAQTYLRELSLL